MCLSLNKGLENSLHIPDLSSTAPSGSCGLKRAVNLKCHTPEAVSWIEYPGVRGLGGVWCPSFRHLFMIITSRLELCDVRALDCRIEIDGS